MHAVSHLPSALCCRLGAKGTAVVQPCISGLATRLCLFAAIVVRTITQLMAAVRMIGGEFIEEANVAVK